uniref:Uncharacterized protein n=1 Tax=Rhizophora mucronata TaxID=61149 RepID=A0A2P2R4V9_RHIMU
MIFFLWPYSVSFKNMPKFYNYVKNQHIS